MEKRTKIVRTFEKNVGVAVFAQEMFETSFVGFLILSPFVFLTVFIKTLSTAAGSCEQHTYQPRTWSVILKDVGGSKSNILNYSRF